MLKTHCVFARSKAVHAKNYEMNIDYSKEEFGGRLTGHFMDNVILSLLEAKDIENIDLYPCS